MPELWKGANASLKELETEIAACKSANVARSTTVILSNRTTEKLTINLRKAKEGHFAKGADPPYIIPSNAHAVYLIEASEKSTNNGVLVSYTLSGPTDKEVYFLTENKESGYLWRGVLEPTGKSRWKIRQEAIEGEHARVHFILEYVSSYFYWLPRKIADKIAGIPEPFADRF